MERTFRVEDLLNLFATNVDSTQVIVNFDDENESYTARMRPTAEARGEDDPPAEIIGCPYPPGCTP